MLRIAVRVLIASVVIASAALVGASEEASAAGTKTCAELLACCGKIKDKGTHNSCVDTYKRKAGNDTDCDVVYPAFQLYCDPANAPKPVPKPKP